MPLGLFILILAMSIDTIFESERRNFPCFDTILHSLFYPIHVYLQHFFTARRPENLL